MIKFKSPKYSPLKFAMQLLIMSCLIFFSQTILAQTDSLKLDKKIDDSIDSTTVQLAQDSVKVTPTEVEVAPNSDKKKSTVTQDSIKTIKEKSKPGIRSIFKGKPGKAFALSLALPGAGQLYNKRYWKVPLAIGIEGLFIWNIVNTRDEFQLFDGMWRYALANPTEAPFEINGIPYQTAAQINSSRTIARRNKEYAWLYWIGARLVVSIEAFVDQHLIDFDISDDLSVKMEPVTGYNLYGQASIIPSMNFVWKLN